MKSILSFLLIFFAVIACAQEQPVDNRKYQIVFHSVNVIPMDKEQVLQNQTVRVLEGKIIDMFNDGDKKIKYGPNTIHIDGKGKYLMPGLAEMHAHVPPTDDLQPMKDLLVLFAVNGVTTIRGMLGHPKHLELRTKINSGEILGPRFYTSGPSLNGQTVRSVDSADYKVRQQKQAGYDFLKLHPGLTRENFDAIAKTAKEVNIPFAGHVSFNVGVWRAIDAGYASIDHMDGFVESLVPGIDTIKENQTGPFAMFISKYADESRIPKLVAALRDHHIWVVPTQSLAERWFSPDKDADALSKEPEMVYMNATTLNNWINAKKNIVNNPQYKPAEIAKFVQLRRKLIYECNKNGVGLLLGSDAPQIFNVPGFSLHHELQYMVNSGLTPYEALRMGTVNPATYFNSSDRGIIKTGNVSDLILLNGNPLRDISQINNIEGVMLRDRWLPKKYIEQELRKLKQ